MMGKRIKKIKNIRLHHEGSDLLIVGLAATVLLGIVLWFYIDNKIPFYIFLVLIGLPTPANALFWGSLIVGGKDAFANCHWSAIIIIILMFVMSYMLIAEVPMFSLKFKHWNWSENKLRWSFLIFCIPLLFIFQLAAFSVIVAWYVVLSVASVKKDD